MKKWLLKKLGFIIDIFRPEKIRGMKIPEAYKPRFLPPERGPEFAAMLDAKMAQGKKIKIKTADLKNPLAGIQHEPLAHTPIHSQQTPLVRAMGRRKNIQQTVKEIQAKIYKQSITSPKSGTSI